MRKLHHVTEIRVRYSDTDQMGTYYNSRPLEWFECARSELMRSVGRSYRQVEQEGLMMPVREAHVEYLGRAQYDDLLRITSVASRLGRAQVRFDMEVRQADSGQTVCRGYTIHAIVDATGKPVRPPAWLVEMFAMPAT